MGRADDADIDAELELRPDRRWPPARGGQPAPSIPDAAHKAAAWQLMTQSQELGHEGVAAVAAGFGQPEHAELLAPYVDHVLRRAAGDLGDPRRSPQAAAG